jgi:hypothetical protein
MISIEPTKSTPRIYFEEATNTLEILGELFPENSFAFFDPVFSWFNSTLPDLTSFTLKLGIRYMNSSSTKCILDILDMLSDSFEKGCDIKVLWLYEKGNDRALDLAEEFKEDFSFPFEVCPI